MPYKDPKKKRKNHSKWMKDQIDNGYGKWLYAQRKLFVTDAERFRACLQAIIDEAETLEAAQLLASKALRESDKDHEQLGSWKEKRVLSKIRKET